MIDATALLTLATLPATWLMDHPSSNGVSGAKNTTLLAMWPPPLHKHIECLNSSFPRPSLVIVNKFEDEWDSPINFMIGAFVKAVVDEFERWCGSEALVVYSHNRGQVSRAAAHKATTFNPILLDDSTHTAPSLRR